MSGASQPTHVAAAPDAAPPQRAVRSVGAVALFLAISAAGLAADLVSKHLVFQELLSDPAIASRARALQARTIDPLEPDTMLQALRLSKPVAPGVEFTLSTNAGVVFGLPMPRLVVAGATLVTIVLIGGFFATSPRRSHGLHTALALILAGALGNLYDRLFSAVQVPGDGVIHNQVRDFIDCSEIGYRWIFNVADAWLVIGAIVLGIHWLAAVREEHRRAVREKTPGDQAG